MEPLIISNVRIIDNEKVEITIAGEHSGVLDCIITLDINQLRSLNDFIEKMKR